MNKALVQQIHQWFSTDLGKAVLDYEQEKIKSLVSNLFGYLAVQIGMPSVDFLAYNRMRSKWIVPSFDLSNADYPAPYLQGIEGKIPLEDQSTDLIVLPHTLEVCKDPKKILEDVHRVLVHNGYAVVIGFNPNHLWGLRRLYQSSQTIPIPYRQLISQYRIKDWFKQLDFDIILPIEKTERTAIKKNYWQFVANNPWIAPEGSVYCVLAQKRTLGLHLIGPAFRKKTHGNIAIITQHSCKK